MITDEASALQIRVLVAALDKSFTDNLVRFLNEASDSRIVPNTIVLSSPLEDKDSLNELCQQVRKSKCHFVLIETAAMGRLNMTQAFCEGLDPCKCIILTKSQIQTEFATRTFLSNALLMPKGRNANSRLSLINLLLELASQNRAKRLTIHPLHLLASYVDSVDFPTSDPHREIVELLYHLYPKAQKLILEPFRVPIQTSGGDKHRSLLLNLRVDDRLSVILKITERGKIKNEEENYQKYIEGNLVGSRHAKIERVCKLWELGAIVYSFVGTVNRQAPKSLTHYYSNQPNQDVVEKTLDNLFRNVWSHLYRTTRSQVTNTGSDSKSLFEQYDEVWGNKLKRSLPGADQVEPYKKFPGVNAKLINPIWWTLQHTNSSTTIDAYAAHTHGDMHAENILIDDEGNCWVIDFERSGPGPELQDFVELECDIVTRLIPLANDDFRLLCDIATCLVGLQQPNDPLVPDFAIPSFANNIDSLQIVFGSIAKLRALADSVTKYEDFRAYLWGLLLNCLFLLTVFPESHPRHQKALLFGAVICTRLDNWTSASHAPMWPPIELDPNNKVDTAIPTQRDISAIKVVDEKRKVIFNLLVQSFDDNEFRTFCWEFDYEFYKNLPDGMLFTTKVRELVNHCFRREIVHSLLEKIRPERSTTFARFEDQLFSND